MWMLEKVCHITYSVEGLENIPTDRTWVVLSKHQSTWETFFLPLIFHDPAVILKRELLWLPFFGWGLAASDPIAIDRTNKTKAMQQVIEKGKKRLEAGRWVIVFPEGTRVAPGAVGHYRLGGPRLAVATGFPVIPVAHNAGYAWPRRKFIKRPGVIRVVIGPAIESNGRTAEEVLALAKDWIETTMLRIDGLVNKSTGQ
jgi:1-acyl-sn-glycerol-3-phosphate acyltransferase